MEGIVPGSIDQKTETGDVEMIAVVAPVLSDSDEKDQNDTLDEMNLEIQIVESIQEPQEDIVSDSKNELENSETNDDCFLEIKTVETLKEVPEDELLGTEANMDDIKKENDEDFERDLSNVEPNRDQETCTLEKIVIQNTEDKENVLKLSHELEKLKVIVLELANFFPHYQPRTKEKVLLNLPLRNKKELDEKDFDVFKSSLEGKQFGSDFSNGGIENLNEILEFVSPVLTLQEKLSRSTRIVSDLCNKLIEYVDHLKRKVEKSKSENKKCETIGVKKVAICRRKNDFPIVGISERDISPIRENFCIKKVISKVEDTEKTGEKGKKSKSQQESQERSKDSVSPIRDNFNVRKVLDSVQKKDKSKLVRNFKPWSKNLVVSIDRLRTNMIFALKTDDKFVLKRDWEFFTNMFRKEALKWKKREKLNHLERLDVEEHVSNKLGDPIWKFLDSKLMTEDRIERIRVYNKKLEKEFSIKHDMAEFSDEETVATKKLKKGLFCILKNNNNYLVQCETVKILDLIDSFDFPGDKIKGGKLIEETKQDTLDFLENDDLLPETRNGNDVLAKLELAFSSIVKDIWNLPKDQHQNLGNEILNNLEFEVQKQEYFEQSKVLKLKIKVLFEKNDRYCATGDEKYYLDLPGREGEKLLPSEVRTFLRDFQSDQLTKTLQSRFDKFKNEQNCDNIKSFNAKLKACVKNIDEKVKNCPEVTRKRRIEGNSADLKDELRDSRNRNRKKRRIRSKSPVRPKFRKRTKSPKQSRNKRILSRSPRRRSRSHRRSRSRNLGRRLTPERNFDQTERLPFAPFNMNNPMANNEILSAASNIIGSMTPIAVLQVMAMNGDPRASAALAAADNSDQDMRSMRNMEMQMQNKNSFLANQGSLADSRPVASFGHMSGGQTDRLFMGENQDFNGKTDMMWDRSGNVGNQNLYNRSNVEYGMMGSSNSSQQNSFSNSSIQGQRQGSRHNSDDPMLIRESNHTFGEQQDMNEFGKFGGSDSFQQFPAKSDEKSQPLPWTRPKFNPYANQEAPESTGTPTGWNNGSNIRQGTGLGRNPSGQGSSFSSNSLATSFPIPSKEPAESFSRSFNRDAPASQGRGFSENSSERNRMFQGSSSNAQVRPFQNSSDNNRSFQENGGETNRFGERNHSDINHTLPRTSSNPLRLFQMNSSGVNGSDAGNSFNQFTENRNMGLGNNSEESRSYPQNLNSDLRPGTDRRNNIFRSLQEQNRR